MDYYPKSSFLFMVIPSTNKQGWFSVATDKTNILSLCPSLSSKIKPNLCAHWTIHLHVRSEELKMVLHLVKKQ